MSSKEMQISEEEYYATLLSNPDYSETKFSIYRFKNLINGKVYIGQTTVPVGYNIESGGKDGRKGIKLTEVHKQKLLEANLGKPRKENTREAIKNTHKELWKNDKYRKEHLDVVKCSLSSYWQKSSKKVYQYDKHGNFIAVWNKCKDVVDFLYGIGANGNLSRNIKLNNKRGKLGFSKNGYIWSFFAPQGKEEL